LEFSFSKKENQNPNIIASQITLLKVDVDHGQELSKSKPEIIHTQTNNANAPQLNDSSLKQTKLTKTVKLSDEAFLGSIKQKKVDFIGELAFFLDSEDGLIRLSDF
jgi:hypothetical protein